MEYTGERFMPHLTGEIKHQHLHRYALSHEFVSGKAVLDIASGEGYGSALLATAAHTVVGVDIDPEAILHAQTQYGAERNLEFRVGTCDAIPLPDDSVDVVTCFETIEHHDKHLEMMAEIKRVLRPDGVLIISSPNRPIYSEQFNYENPFHVKELDYEEFVDLLSNHFKFVQVYGQKLAAGSFVFALSDVSKDSYTSYASNGEQVGRKLSPLKSPAFFFAVCSDDQIEPGQVLSSIFIDTHEELLQDTHDELTALRIAYARDVNESRLMLQEITSSLTFQFVTRVVWPISGRFVPGPVRAQLKRLLRSLKRRLSRIPSPATWGRVADDIQAEPPRSLSPISPLRRDVSAAVDFIPEKIAPLNLTVSPNSRRHINFVMGAVYIKYLFAGVMCVFNLALKLKRSGYSVRLVIVEPCDYQLSKWKSEIADYEGLQDLFDEVEVAYVADRSIPLEVSSSDVFLAMSWWTAHIAHRAAKELKQEKFIYLIQEYEPLFHPAGSLYALAEQAYSLPHHAIFSTEVLRDYFQQNQVGVFAPGSNHQADSSPIVIRNAVNSFQISEQKMRSRKHRKLFFYARPESLNNPRNMFEMGVLALREAIKEGHFDLSNWEFHGIGAMSKYRNVPLVGHVELKMVPGMSLPNFVKLLPSYDLGLSLMLTPHTSLMPLDMAAAGLVTVTNTFATKTAEKMAAISPNIIAVPPTLDELKAGLVLALKKVENFEERMAGSQLNWSRSWAETFNEPMMARLKEFIG